MNRRKEEPNAIHASVLHKIIAYCDLKWRPQCCESQPVILEQSLADKQMKNHLIAMLV